MTFATARDLVVLFAAQERAQNAPLYKLREHSSLKLSALL